MAGQYRRCGEHRECGAPEHHEYGSSAGRRRAVLGGALGALALLACAALVHLRGLRAVRRGAAAEVGPAVVLAAAPEDEGVPLAAFYGLTVKGTGKYVQVGENDLGLCGYSHDWFPKSLPRVTLSSADVDGVKACGMCVKVWSEDDQAETLKSEGGTVFLVDNFADYYKKGTVGFALEETERHDLEILWRAVPCPVGKSTIQYYLEGSSAYYVKVKPFNFTYPLAKVEIRGEEMKHYVEGKTPIPGYYEVQSADAQLKFPIDVRITGLTGEVVEEQIPKLLNGKPQPGTKKSQFLKAFGSEGILPAPNGCKGSGENCTFSKCCTSPDHKCYRKNERWASCKESCEKGEVDPHDTEGHRKPWACGVLGGYGCSAVGHDCSQSQCCRDAGLKCFQKNHKWAGCKASCEPGKPDPNDPVAERSPWSCDVLGGSASPPPARRL